MWLGVGPALAQSGHSSNSSRSTSWCGAPRAGSGSTGKHDWMAPLASQAPRTNGPIVEAGTFLTALASAWQHCQIQSASPPVSKLGAVGASSDLTYTVRRFESSGLPRRETLADHDLRGNCWIGEAGSFKIRTARCNGSPPLLTTGYAAKLAIRCQKVTICDLSLFAKSSG